MLAARCKPQAASVGLMVSFEAGNQRRQHFVDFFNWFYPLRAILNVAELFANQNHGFEFLQGTESDVKASSKVSIRTSSMALCDVRGNRDHGTLHLRSQAESFRSRQRFSEAINSWAQQKALFPNFQVFKISSSHKSRLYTCPIEALCQLLAACRFFACSSMTDDRRLETI